MKASGIAIAIGMSVCLPSAFAQSTQTLLTNHTASVTTPSTSYSLSIDTATVTTYANPDYVSFDTTYTSVISGNSVIAGYFSDTSQSGVHAFNIYVMDTQTGDGLMATHTGIDIFTNSSSAHWTYGTALSQSMLNDIHSMSDELAEFYIVADVANASYLAPNPVNVDPQDIWDDCMSGCTEDFPQPWDVEKDAPLSPSQILDNCIARADRIHCTRQCYCLVVHDNSWWRRRACLLSANLKYELDLAVCAADAVNPFTMAYYNELTSFTSSSSSVAADEI